MDDKPKKAEEKARHENQSPGEGEEAIKQPAERREVPKEELEAILEAHREWIESKGDGGAWANLQGANLQGANLQGANLRLAENLTQQQLDGACGDEETKLSEGLTIRTCPEEQEEGSNDG